MKRSSTFGLRLFTSAFLILFTFAQPLLAIESLLPVEDVTSTESVVTDTQGDILDEGISDPEEIAKPTWVTSGESATTSSPVVVGETYVYPNNADVSVTFSTLPEVSSTLTIRTVYLTDEQVKATNAASDVAYDITTDMTDGSFEYDLTLPKVGDNTKVIYAENVSGLTDAKDISNVVENGSSLKVENLNHFTIFVVTTDVAPLTGSVCIAEGASSGSDCYNSIQDAINAASNGDTIIVKAGTYEISSTIVVNKGVSIVGVGMPKIINTSTPSHSVFNITASNVTISGFELTISESFATAGTEVANAIIAIPGGLSLSNISINNNNIHANYPSGTLQKDMYARGITVDNNAVTSLSVTNNTISNVRNGVIVRNVNTANVSNNTIFNTKGGIMHYTSSFADAANRTMSGNNWTAVHNEWDIVWNSATYGFPNYEESLLDVSSANNNAYVVDLRRNPETVVANLTNNRSHVFVINTGVDKVHQTSGNMNEPFATLQYAQNIVTPGGTIILQSDLHTSAQTNINKPLTIKGNDYVIYSEFTKTDNSNNSAIGIHSNNVSLLDLSVDGTNGTNLHGINIYTVKNILLDNIRISYNDYAAVVVNGSEVTVNNISTTDNGWGGINVDLGTGVTTNAELVVTGTSRHTESAAIWIDNITEPATVIDYENQYDYVDNGNTRIYYLSMEIPTVLGWNIKNSPSDSPSLPRPNTELSCNAYTNINGASSHWTDVSGGNSLIKYERQFKYNLGSGWTNWAGSEVYSNPYTNFRTFGSSIGNDGMYDTQVRAFVDLNGNNTIDANEPRSGWSDSCQITFDKTTPTISNINVDKTFVKAGDTVTITADVTDNTGVLAVSADFSNNEDYSNRPTPSSISMSLVSGSTYSATFVIPADWADGQIFVKVAARDLTGSNWVRSTEFKTFVVDNTGPEAPMTVSPTPEQYFKSQPILNDWSNVTDPSGMQGYRVEYKYDDGHTFPNAPYRTTTTSQRNHTPNVNEQGGVSFRVQGIDSLGNYGTWSEWVHYYYDTTAPSKPVITNTPDNTYTNVNAITVNWTGGDDTAYVNSTGAGIASYSIRYVFSPANGSADLPWTSGWVSSGNPHTRSGSFGHGEGKYVIYVKTIDLAGNVSPESNPYTITYDKTIPSSEFTVDISNTFHNTPIAIQGESTDISGVTRVSLYYKDINSSDWILIVTKPNTSNSTTFTWSHIWTPPYQGTFDVKASATDQAGNTENSPQMNNIVFDTKKPIFGNIQISQDYFGKYVNGYDGFNISVHVNDNLSGVKSTSCKYTLNGYVWMPGTYTADNCTFSVPNSILFNDADLDIQVKVRDNAGNPATSRVTEREVDKEYAKSKVNIANNFYGPNYLPLIAGTASDSVSKVTDVKITMQRDSDNQYWVGNSSWSNSFGTQSTWFLFGNWTLARLIPSSIMDNGVNYTITPYAWDQVQDIAIAGTSDSFTWDSEDPTDPEVIFASHTERPNKDRTIDITFGGADDDGSGVAGYFYSFTNTPQTPSIRFSNWLPYGATQVTSPELADGTWYFNIRTVDNVGNITSTTHSIPFVIDTTNPDDPILISPSDNTFTRGEVLTNSWSDTSTDVDYFVYESYHDAGLSNLRWRQNVDGTSKTATNVSDATFWWRVKAVDFAGNESGWSEVWKVTIDNTNPTTPTNLYFMDLDNEEQVLCGGYSNTKHVSEYWDASVDTNLDHYEYSSYNAPNGSAGLVSRILYNNYYDTSFWTVPSEGTYGFQVRAVDKAGNKSEWALVNATGIENSCQITIDWVAPVIDISTPSGLIRGTVDVIGSLTDLNPSTYTLEIKNTLTRDKVMLDVDQPTGEFTDQTLYTWDTTLGDDGEYDITFTGKDLAGNSTTIGITGIIVDNTNPTATVLAALSFTTGDTTPRSLALSDNHELAQVCYSLDGVTQPCIDLIPGLTSYSWDITTLINTLSVGNHTFTYYVVDTAGNRSNSGTIEGTNDPYLASITVNDVPAVQGAAIQAPLFAAATPVVEEILGEQTTEEEETTSPETQEEVKGTLDTNEEESAKKPIPWWVYAIGGTALLSFIIFLIARRRKEEEDKEKNIR